MKTSEFTATFGDPLSEQSKAWSHALFARLKDGGSWGVPRSGMIFQKRGNKLVLISRMPHMKEMPITAEQLKEQQDSDLDVIRKSFNAVGIEVEDVSNVTGEEK